MTAEAARKALTCFVEARSQDGSLEQEAAELIEGLALVVTEGGGDFRRVIDLAHKSLLARTSKRRRSQS